MISLKRATFEDAKIITEIKTRAYNQEINTYLGRNGGPPGYDSIDSEIDIINSLIAYKICLNTTIIGAFFLIPKDDLTMYFEDFVIDPCYQGNGYGFKTLKLLESMYPHIKSWYLTTPIFSIGNQHLYKKFGFKEISRDEDEITYCKSTS